MARMPDSPLAQLIPDEIGAASEKIWVVAGDTDRCPYSWGTFAGRSLVISGGACKLAVTPIDATGADLAGELPAAFRVAYEGEPPHVIAEK
jgi:aerobic carbon-monoxide dehydrogenase large subunit